MRIILLKRKIGLNIHTFDFMTSMNPIISKVKKMLHSVAFSFTMGLMLVFYSLYEIYEDFYRLTHEHLLLLFGVLMLLNCLRHLYKGIHKILIASSSSKLNSFYKKGDRFLDKPLIGFFIGVLIIIVSVLAILDDFDKMTSKTGSIIIGILLMVEAVSKTLDGMKKVKESTFKLRQDK